MIYEKWLNEWLELYVKVSTKERTYKKYRLQAEKYVVPALGGYDLDGLGAVVLQRFAASLACRNLAANTVNGVLTLVKSSLKKLSLRAWRISSFPTRLPAPDRGKTKLLAFAKPTREKSKNTFCKTIPRIFSEFCFRFTRGYG